MVTLTKHYVGQVVATRITPDQLHATVSNQLWLLTDGNEAVATLWDFCRDNEAFNMASQRLSLGYEVVAFANDGLRDATQVELEAAVHSEGLDPLAWLALNPQRGWESKPVSYIAICSWL